MYTLLTVLIIIGAVLMVGTVAIQDAKGSGFNPSIATFTEKFGHRRSTTFIERLTWSLAFIIMALCVMTSHFTG